MVRVGVRVRRCEPIRVGVGDAQGCFNLPLAKSSLRAEFSLRVELSLRAKSATISITMAM